MRRYTCMIVDDEQDAREALTLLVKRHVGYLDIVAEAANIEEAEAILARINPDILFLDVELGHSLIFELLGKQAINARLIFTTAHDQYAFQAIKARAADYLLKPIRSSELKEAVDKACTELDKDHLILELNQLLEQYNVKRLSLPVKDQIRLASLNEVIYCRADNNYTQLELVDNEQIVVTKTLKHFEDLLPPETFIRVHQSYIVNTNYIKKLLLGESELLLKNDFSVPVSRARKQKLKEFMKSA
ncbi:MAG: response regulator transcription factor [Roseivirga sp.]|nr:response regulator transcription factor [Roseivirga sp.]